MKTHSTSGVTDAPSGTRRLHRRIENRLKRRCVRCMGYYMPTRADAQYCSHRCRTIAYRIRTMHWALVTWGKRGLHAQFRYFASAAEASAAAPATAPFTVIDISKPVRPLPSLSEFLRTRLIPGDGDPYPNHDARGGWPARHQLPTPTQKVGPRQPCAEPQRHQQPTTTHPWRSS